MPVVYPSTPEGIASLASRFWTNVDKSGDCWLWTRTRQTAGYGRLRMNGALASAHRISYFLAYGPFPDDHFICHKCDVPSCVRPDHLFVGTPKDNVLDMISKGRARHVYGSRASRSRLTQEQVDQIRAEYVPGFGGELARRYGVSVSSISNIIIGVSWQASASPSAGRVGRLYGESHASAKLTQLQVNAIRDEWAASKRRGLQTEMSRRYGVHLNTIFNILHGDSWRK